ncbi:unnamed protein product [Cylicostephanus goldi]|uniref:Metalloendopeptidase n=1 Tax=Cylicostephanus goldi TaxID=71465 RepID=A0A3P6T149_CYLGO|nr:unnamed protein product [Cylicostephanus goldi]
MALHEIGHALGFFHTHSRHDRDQYILVDKGAVESYAIRQFNKENASRNHNYGVPYDYGSIMHYNSRHFAKDLSAKGRRSMVPIDAGYVDTLGSPFLSFYDKLMMNFHYNCFQICKTKPTEVVKHSPNKQHFEAFNNDAALSSLGSKCGERLWCDGFSGRNSPHAERLSYGNAPLGSSRFGRSPLFASPSSGPGRRGRLGKKFQNSKIYGLLSSLHSAFGRYVGFKSASASSYKFKQYNLNNLQYKHHYHNHHD